MPIRPENKARYPKDWKQISLRIRARADNKCWLLAVARRAASERARVGYCRACIHAASSCDMRTRRRSFLSPATECALCLQV